MEKNPTHVKKMHRAMLVLCGLVLFAVIALPLWRIELDAPQYPEGLEMLIYSHKLDGDVPIINGLNHYIGMKELHAEDFVEFAVLPYIIAGYALLFVLVGAWGHRKAVYWLFGLFLMFGAVAMVDFWHWLYDYGHNLDPNAAIIVPGMAYQPPLIGYKELLNFLAFSIPASGGWLFIGCGLALAYCVFSEWRSSFSKKLKSVG